jgi:hypothetical protein
MPRPTRTKAKSPGVSYAAEDWTEELFLSVRSTPAGTTVSLWYATRTRGDLPQQGHAWTVKAESTKASRGVLHLSNLAAWAARRAISGLWEKQR